MIERTEGSNERVVTLSEHILKTRQNNGVHKKINKKNGESESENRNLQRS